VQKPIKIVVFLGPSLPIEKAKEILPDAIYLPPCKQSDLLSVATIDQPNVIILIDGVFGQSLSVWHKEILFALSKGIHVIGCSSMGAIRAAECHEFGMQGFGKIFWWYKNGNFEDDDVVAVTHSHEGVPTSLPMVNVAETLVALLAENEIECDDFEQVHDAFRKAYFPDRTLKLVPKWMRSKFQRNYVDVKGEDAEFTLRHVRDNLSKYESPFVPDFKMRECHLFNAQYERDRRVRRNDGEVPLAEIDGFLALQSDQFERINWDANNRLAARVLSEVLNLEPSAEEWRDEASRFCAVHGIRCDDDFSAWLNRNDLSGSEFNQLMLENAKIRKLHKALHVSKVACRNTKTVLDHLRITGEYPSVADEAASQEMAVNRVAPDFMHCPISREPIESILEDHCQDMGVGVPCDLNTWLRESGFQNENELRIALSRVGILRGNLKSQKTT
jgi:hypothetical protein